MAKKSKDKREPRKKTKGIDFLQPVDFSNIGTPDDPCFGKHYNLSTDECKRCGDSELCSVLFAINLNKDRAKIEKKQEFKDLNDNNNQALENWVKSKKREGLSRAETIKKAKHLFGSSRDEVKKLYNKK